MGHGEYSLENRTTRASIKGYEDKTPEQNFTRRTINNAMNPHGVTVREARDSDDHPISIPIILALDVTGSMGAVPNKLLQNGLPTMMSTIIQAGTPDPALLFAAIGDHEWDSAPLQVAQFESSDELLDKWLEEVYLEGGGGGNAGESYLLAWLFAARHTETDHWEKRGEKGFLFTVGDEPCLQNLPASQIKKITGAAQASDVTAVELLDEARKYYHVYHIHIHETPTGGRQSTIDSWKQLMGPNLVVLEDHANLGTTVGKIVVENTLQQPAQNENANQETTEEEDSSEGEILL